MCKDSRQLSFDFESSDNSLVAHLNKGDFVLFFEYAVPPAKKDFNAELSLFKDMNQAVQNIKGLHAGIALNDKMETTETWNIANFAAAGLSNNTLDRNLIYLSGKDKSPEAMTDTIQQCVSSGLRNLVPVTGDGYLGKEPKQQCLDSIHTLKTIKSLNNSEVIFPGSVVNPFKYSRLDIFPQYFKLVKKINLGARFAVAQMGWDMMKYQELRWFLDQRELHYPTIARLILLTPELVEKILNGDFPGVHISRDFKLILEKERTYGKKQFASAQWRRLQLQVAGCRLLGYSGVQITGIERPEHISTAAARIKSALEEFKDLEVWKQTYIEHISRSDMAPFEHRFYLYTNLFKGDKHTDPIPNPDGIAPCSLLEKLHYKLCRSIFSKDHMLAPDEHRLSKKILTGCTSCGYCRLPYTHYICPETCPKGLANGPCGGSKVDGSCEIMDKKCIHLKRTKLAGWKNEVDLLEEHYIKHPNTSAKINL